MRKVVRRQNKIELTAQKKDGENRPFVTLTWCQASEIGLPVGTREDALQCFSIQPFNTDGVASKTFLRALRHFAFTAEFAKRRRRLWETAQKKGRRKPSLLWR